jgi:hypothetical protein
MVFSSDNGLVPGPRAPADATGATAVIRKANRAIRRLGRSLLLLVVLPTACRPAILVPSRERPMYPRALDDALEVLSQQVTPSNQIHRQTSDSLQVVVDASISLLERQARITISSPRRLGLGERKVRPDELVDVLWIADRRIAEIPARRRRHRHRDLGVANSSDVVSIPIDLRHEVRKSNDLAANHAGRPSNLSWICDTFQRRKTDLGDADQCAVAETRVLARWRRSVLAGPLVPGVQQPPVTAQSGWRCRAASGWPCCDSNGPDPANLSLSE